MSEGQPRWREKDVGSAFSYSVDKLFSWSEPGISQRGYYAAAALQGMVARVGFEVTGEFIAQKCVEIADAVIAELKK